jgi:PKHD-type hydroxylase
MNLKNMQRKLSMSVQLSKPKDYEGGDLKFNLRGLDSQNGDTVMSPPPEFKQQGSIVVFPSFLWHKVEPITKGIRYSLVMWAIGENWK